MNPIGTIAVGVNRSPEPGAPIEFAKREAIRRPAWLRVVAAAQHATCPVTIVGPAALTAPTPAAVARPDGYEARRWWRPRHIRRPARESKAGATTAAELMTTGVQTVTAATRVPAAARTMLGQHLSELDTRLDAQVAVRLIERVEGVVAVVDHLRFHTDERVADPNATPTY